LPKRSSLHTLPIEVFLSHSSHDRGFVARLTKVLRRCGINYWYSAKHIVGARQWHDEIGRALARCDWFAVILSPESVRSMWVKHELVYALNEERYNDKIVPLLRKPCSHSRLSWTLGEFQFVDFTGDFDKGCRQLLRIWNLSYQPPAAIRRAVKKR